MAFRWVRPLHSIIFVFDGKPIVASFKLGNFDQKTGNETFGHRFLAPGKITVSSFADYQSKLRAAKVILDPTERRATIWKQAEALAALEGLTVKQDEALLDEVTGLVEWPRGTHGQDR